MQSNLLTTYRRQKIVKTTKSIKVALLKGCLCCVVLSMPGNIVQGADVKSDIEFKATEVINITSDEPMLLTREVAPGTTVIWLNSGRRIMELTFTDKQVVTACGSPTKFYVNEAGAYASNKILPNATASLCFIEKGEYTYKLVLRSLGRFGPDGSIRKEFKGKVVVR